MAIGFWIPIRMAPRRWVMPFSKELGALSILATGDVYRDNIRV